ncbi:aldolase, partial [bacterium]|nr:aldolase [bacterium]
TTHGGVPLPDGSIAEANLDFETLEKLSNIVIKDYGLAGCVQHGASTLPSEAFYHFPRTRTAEVHLATEYQNMIYDHPIFPENLKEEVYGHLKKAHANEWKEGQSEEQFIYKTRKKGFGPFKKKFWDLPEEVREKICQDLEETFDFLFKELGAANTYAATKEKISRVYVQRPMPEALKARIS